MLLIALALHGVFLLLPIGGGTKTPESSEEEEKPVQVQPSPSAQLNPQLSNDPTALGLNGQLPSRPNLTPQLSNNQILSRTDSQRLLQQKLAAQLADTNNLLDSGRKTVVRSNASQPNRQTRSQSTSSRRQSTPHRQGTSAVDRWRQQSARQQAAAEPPSNRSQEQRPATAQSATNQSQQQRPSGVSTFSNQSQNPTPPPPPAQAQPSETARASREQQPPQTSLQQKPALISPGTFFRDFPYYLGSLMTSGGILQPKFNDSKYIYHTSDSLKDVAEHFEKQLKDKGFTLEATTNEDNFKVYKVSRDNTSQFLHLVSQDEKTAIFLDSESQSLDELKNQEKTEDAQPELVKFYDTFKQKVINNPELQLQKLEQSDLERFPEADALRNINEKTDNVELDRFLEKLLLDRLEVITSPAKPIPLEQLTSTISSELTNGEDMFKVEQVGTYGGGNLYEVTKDDNFKIYMILVSTQDKKIPRTGIILSKDDPRG